jgi:hypothetical protein
MTLKTFAPWVPFGFSVALSAISLVTYAVTGGSGAWIPAFVSFLPMAFFLAVASQHRARAQVEALETRVRDLEAAAR